MKPKIIQRTSTFLQHSNQRITIIRTFYGNSTGTMLTKFYCLDLIIVAIFIVQGSVNNTMRDLYCTFKCTLHDVHYVYFSKLASEGSSITLSVVSQSNCFIALTREKLHCKIRVIQCYAEIKNYTRPRWPITFFFI